MLMINFSEPFQIVVALLLFVLVLWLAKQYKRSALIGLMLFVFLSILVGHSVQLGMGLKLGDNEIATITNSIVFDIVFIFLSFLSYLWVDDIEAKFRKKKSIDNSLDWFWSKV